MDNPATLRAKKRYDELFPNETCKARAFDKLSEKYYFANFGSSSKADIDVLFFSIYLEQILESSESDLSTYDDYTLSKLLGITQSRVSNLKVKKELQYPYVNFSWQDSFARIIRNFRYENGKIKLFIPDKNLYYELKHVIENSGGYIDVQLNSTLLQINPEYFVDLLIAVMPDQEKHCIKKELKGILQKHKVSTKEFEQKSFGDILKGSTEKIVHTIVTESICLCIPKMGECLAEALSSLSNLFSS